MLTIDEEMLVQSQRIDCKLLSIPADNSLLSSTKNEGFRDDDDIVRQYDNAMGLVIVTIIAGSLHR